MQHLLEGLTSAQREAVLHHEGPLLILAGPGSGKTRVVTHRIAQLLNNGVHGSQILALTFTNKASDEMRSRVERMAPRHRVWVSTFHRFCARLLRQYATYVGIEENYTIYDTGDSSRALRRAINKAQLNSTHVTPNSIASAISWAKNNLILPAQYRSRDGHVVGALVEKVYPIYQKQLAESYAVDFDDLLLHSATILRENPEIRATLDERYRFILVDEYQDTNLAQYAIVRALSIDHPHLAVTGDPDQSIYGWRGANLNNILKFEKDFPDVRVVRLERNYRSTKRILRAASQLIAHNVRRKEKDLFTENDEGKPVRLVTYSTQTEEAEEIAQRIADDIHAGRRPSEFAIFYRVNALSRAIEFALREHGIPYQMVHGLEFFQRQEIKDILAYLQLLNNPRDEVALLRVINTPTRGIGKTTIERLTTHAARSGFGLLDAAREATKVEGLSKRSASLVAKFVAMFDRVAAAASGPVEETLGLVLNESGYQQRLHDSKNEEDEQRLANIEELLTVARDFDERCSHEGFLDAVGTPEPGAPSGYLEAFLEESSLINDTDDWETKADRVTLMTLHASKGLEFPVIYLIAAEEGLLPHERSRHDPNQLEEERRLLFVGITRAEQELQISRAEYRDFRGKRKMTVPSQFLMELPREDMELQTAEFESSFSIEPTREEPVFSQSRPNKAKTVTPSNWSSRLTTAAEMGDGGKAFLPADSDVFTQGMVVRHPTHGLGKIVALSGSGARRKATVDFAHPPTRKKFVLANSHLRPLKPNT